MSGRSLAGRFDSNPQRVAQLKRPSVSVCLSRESTSIVLFLSCVCSSGLIPVNTVCCACSSGLIPVNTVCCACSSGLIPVNTVCCACSSGLISLNTVCYACSSGLTAVNTVCCACCSRLTPVNTVCSAGRSGLGLTPVNTVCSSLLAVGLDCVSSGQTPVACCREAFRLPTPLWYVRSQGVRKERRHEQ